MDEPDEGDDPRDALDIAYQRRLSELVALRASLDEASARCRWLEQDVADAGDDQDVSALRARLDGGLAQVHDMTRRVETARRRADAYRVERDRVWSLRDAGNARAAAREALARLADEDRRR